MKAQGRKQRAIVTRHKVIERILDLLAETTAY
jgi:hypothetical protein